VVLLAIQKGRTPEESKERNFGMPRPQGYRKARRAMALAERFSLPVISLIDTPGAYPGLESEASNIGGAIAESLLAMTTLGVPTIAAIIGEGGSGGAIAVGAADRVIMMENAIYSVISPEGAAAILWKAKDRTKEAASALGLTAVRLLDLGAIDAVVPEPLGGAHKDFDRAAAALHSALAAELLAVRDVPTEDLLEARYRRYRAAGVFNTLEDASEEPPSDAPGSES
jgi:acetyl-CoA carboxylase carboxyl transferase subunit alpha